MSMHGRIREVSPALLERVRDEPDLIHSVIGGEYELPPEAGGLEALMSRLGHSAPADLAAKLEVLPSEERASMDAHFANLARAMRDAAEQMHDAGGTKPGELDGLGELARLDQAWHGLHFVLTGSTESTDGDLGQAVLGGVEVGEDLGFGPARVHDPSAVGRIAHALTALSPNDARGRYNPAAMEAAHIYPGSWHQPENLEWILEKFELLRGFYTAVAARGNGVVLYLT